MREFFDLHFKIPLNPPLPAFGRKKIPKGEDDGFSPLAKGS
jgi:hypothetical protein